jgi:hypothetical protein
VHALQSDAHGNLWVLLNRPGSRWREAIVRQPSETGAPQHTVGRMDWYYNTTIEVFDPATRQLLASRTLSQLVLGFADSNHIVTYWEGDDGTPHLDVWRIHLQQR